MSRAQDLDLVRWYTTALNLHQVSPIPDKALSTVIDCLIRSYRSKGKNQAAPLLGSLRSYFRNLTPEELHEWSKDAMKVANDSYHASRLNSR